LRYRAALRNLAVFVLAVAWSSAQEAAPDPRQPLHDAWWTGPVLANSAATLPKGHFLIEPYFYDVISKNQNAWGSRAFILYGLIDRFTVGFIPIIAYNQVGDGLSSSHVGFGDLTPLAQLRLTQFHEGSWVPTSAVQIQQSFPTAPYDRLGNRVSNGFGSGAYITSVAFNTQTYFWMASGRILRMRFNVLNGFSSHANVQDVSVYGTNSGFRGRAYPGRSVSINAAWEYSLTRNWVPALDVIYRHDGNTSVTGNNSPSSGRGQTAVHLNSGSDDNIGLAPAMEYNWNSSLGVIFGARVIAPGHNTSASFAPVIAINYVH
jgi:hypothetical protein